MTARTKKMTTLAVLSAIAYAVMYISRFFPSIVLFLKYDPKDIVIMIGAYIWGPMSGLMMSVVISFLEMITISTTGWIGLIMNILSTCMFVCPAAFIYWRKPSIKSAVIGLICGVLLSTSAMLMWNYFITPIYMNLRRSDVASMLLPIFLPFNLIKGFANSALVLLIYKPIVSSLRKAKLIPESIGGGSRRFSLGLILSALLVLASCVFFVLIIKGFI